MSQNTALARSTATRPSVRPAGRTRPSAPRLQLVAPVAGGSRTRLALVCVTLLVTGLLALLWLNISLSRGAYELDAAQAQHEELVEQVQRLQTQVELDRAPANLARQATAQGMVPAPSTAFLDDDGQFRGKATVASPAPKPPAPAPAGRTAEQKAADQKAAEQKAAEKAENGTGSATSTAGR